MPPSHTPTPADPKKAPARWWLLRCLAFSLFLFPNGNTTLFASTKWTEYNLGPFYVDTDSDPSAARFDLTQLEQLRWVLGGLLEIKDLNATWPIRVLVTNSSKPTGHFVLHNAYYLLVKEPNAPLPLGEVAQLFLDANTPRIPNEVETGLAALFATLKANGSRVSWGSAPSHADLAYARMQLFATKFEYGASFHIFLSSLRNGSSLHVAEHNAFAKNIESLEQEAAARLSANAWEPVSVSGRPLDPKRDFGDHSLDASIAGVYAASALIQVDPNAAEPILKQSLDAGGPTTALALESLGDLAVVRHEKPMQFFEDAIQAGSKSAHAYWAAAEDLPPDQALPLLRKAVQLNPLWAEPIYSQAQNTEDLPEREALLKKAIQLDSRQADYWVALAQAQLANGHALAAQSSWVRAEDAAPDEAKRKYIAKLHETTEESRLNDAEADRKRTRDEERMDDQRAQQSETDRIHAAEERANQASASAAGKPSDADVVDWNALAKPQKIYGDVLMVDCRADYIRVAVKDLRGKTRQLFYRDPDHKMFSCGNKPERRQIVVTFRQHDDDLHGTDGDIVSVAWR